MPTFLAGSHCTFKQPLKVAELLDPERYIRTWPAVPANEVRQSCVEITLCGEICQMLLHSRRITADMKLGNASANLCKSCHACLVKALPEMPTRAKAQVEVMQELSLIHI